MSGFRVYQDLTRHGVPSGLWHGAPSSETCNSRSFARTRFEYWQQPGNFQRLPQVRAEITKLEASAFGFCLSMHFDECAEATVALQVDFGLVLRRPIETAALIGERRVKPACCKE